MRVVTLRKLVAAALIIFVYGCHSEQDVILPKVEIQASIAYDAIAKHDETCMLKFSDSTHNIIDENALIRLRGNSTAEFPKHPLYVRLSRKEPLGGMSPAKKWVLLANYFDKTMLRNALAFKMSEDSQFEWTPHFSFVELYYNGVNQGIYQLCEKVEVHPARVKTPEQGWLIEIDARVTENDNYFCTPHMEHPYRIDWPRKDLTSMQMEQIQQFISEAEDVLFSENFSHPTKGWRKYLDEKTWIDWYLINEIAKNCDGNFYSSCFMHLEASGKIAMGPIWDYDTCFGNCIWDDPRSPEGFYVRHSQWFSRLFEDPVFKQHVHDRFAYYYENRKAYYSFVQEKAKILKPLIIINDNIWHTIGAQISPYLTPYPSYEEDVNSLIEWLEIRLEWLKTNI